MSNFENFLKEVDAVNTAITIELSARCQVCQKIVDFGKYLAEKRLLVWECSDGHSSYIEGFQL